MLFGFDYRSIYNQKVSKSFLRVFGLFTLLFIIFSIKLFLDFNNAFNLFEQSMKDLPYFNIINGELNLEAPQPYYPIPGEENIVIDTTGQTDPSILDDIPSGMLVTKTKVYLKSNYETSYYDLKVINDISNSSNITKNDITSWIMSFKTPVFIIAAVFLSIFELTAKLISALVISLVLLIASAVMKKNINYGTLFSLSLYALILPVVLDWLRSIAGLPVPFFFFIYWTAAVLYGIMGVKKYFDFHEPADGQGPQVVP